MNEGTQNVRLELGGKMKISDRRDKKWGVDSGSQNIYTGRILESKQKKDRWKNPKN